MCWSQAPVSLAGRNPAGGVEAVERVVLKDVRVEVLIPHGIGDHDVMTGDAACRVLELGVDHRVATLYPNVHVVDDRVHVGNGIAVGLQFLAMEPEGHAADGVGLSCDELELDEQPCRAAGVVVALFARLGTHQVCHKDADLGGGEELTCALPRSLGKLAEQVLVGAA